MKTKDGEGLSESGVRAAARGTVHLVGAGPGDPELLTVRAHRLISRARVVAHDLLVPDAILALAPPDAERICVGRRLGRPAVGAAPGAAIHPLVVERALAGIDVVRLKGGDPMTFGRGGEEAAELALLGVPFALVPGVSAALGAASSVGVPLTHRDAAASVTFVTAHRREGTPDDPSDLARRVPHEGTVVVYMGLTRLAEVASTLARGRGAATPAAVIACATSPEERAVFGTLGDIAERVSRAALPAPALLVVGGVVDRRVVSAVRRELPEELAEAPVHRGPVPLPLRA